MNKYKLGNEICKLREDKGMTQGELAVELDVTDKAVSKWENGQAIPRIDKFELLADALDTSVEYLLAVSKDNSSIIFIENNYATALYLDIDGQLVSVSEEGKWVEVNPNGFTMKIKGDFDFSLVDDYIKSEDSIKGKLILKSLKKITDSIENLMLLTNCTYAFKNVSDGETISINIDSVVNPTKLLVLRNFVMTYPKIEMNSGSAELLSATAANKKQYIRSFRREIVWSDIGLGFLWVILEIPFVNIYLKHLCKDATLKKKILNADKYKTQEKKKSKHPVLKVIGIILLAVILFFGYMIFEPVINIKGEYPALVSNDFSSIELHGKTYEKTKELPSDAHPKRLGSYVWYSARHDGESRFDQVTDDYKVQCFEDSAGNKYLWLVKDYSDVILTDDGIKAYSDFDTHDIYILQ